MSCSVVRVPGLKSSLAVFGLALMVGCASKVPLNEPAGAVSGQGSAPAQSAAASQTSAAKPASQAAQGSAATPATAPSGTGVAPKPAAEVAGGSAASKPLMAPGSAGAAAPSALPSVIYFDFDSYALLDDAKTVVADYAKLLSADAKKQFVLEGHTDERGGREYNLALGQKRSESVLKALTVLGARDQQLEAVSFGEERPAASGSGEEMWSKNRRVEFKNR